MTRVSILCVALAATATFACADNHGDDRIGDTTAVGANTAAADRNAPAPGAAGGDAPMAGASDDRTFVEHMLERHAGSSRMGDRGVGTTGETAAQGRHAAAEWASKTMPTVREHLDQAKRINGQMVGK